MQSALLRALVVAGVLSAAAAAADPASIGCQFVWSGPSADNDLITCITGRIPQLLTIFVLALIFLALAVLTTIIYLPFFAIRQCCNGCGGRVLRPGTCCYGGSEWDERQEDAAKEYKTSTVICFRVFAIFVIAVAIAGIVMMAYGVSTLFPAFRSTAVSIIDGGIGTVSGIVSDINSSLVINGSYVPGFDPAVLGNINGLLGDARNVAVNAITTGDSYEGLVVGVAAGLIGGVAVAVLVLLCVMCCSVRSCLPATCTCWSWLWVILYALLATVFIIFNSAALILDGEVTLGRNGQAGIIQWYVVPLCDRLSPSASLESTVNGALRDAAQAACNAMLDVCDTETTASVSNTRQFTCNLTSATVATVCTSASAVQALYANSMVKTGSPVCTSCSLLTCETQCVDSSLRNSSAEVARQLEFAVAAESALSQIFSIITCSRIVNLFLATVSVSALPRTTLILSVGYILAEIACILLIIVFFKGQKLFLSSKERGVDGDMTPKEKYGDTAME